MGDNVGVTFWAGAKTSLRNYWHDENGATAIEYGLILAVLSLVIVGGFAAFGDDQEEMWGRLNKKVSDAT